MHITLEEGYTPGCIGRIAEMHGVYYARTSGFGLTFESRVARGLCDFCANYSAGRDGLWLGIVDGELHGSVAIDGNRAAEEGAQLRWFVTSDRVRGQGLGTRLLEAAIRFADGAGYQRLFLNTFAGLDAARHLYQRQGFRLTGESPGDQWGKRVREQIFVREQPTPGDQRDGGGLKEGLDAMSPGSVGGAA